MLCLLSQGLLLAPTTPPDFFYELAYHDRGGCAPTTPTASPPSLAGTTSKTPPPHLRRAPFSPPAPRNPTLPPCGHRMLVAVLTQLYWRNESMAPDPVRVLRAAVETYMRTLDNVDERSRLACVCLDDAATSHDDETNCFWVPSAFVTPTRCAAWGGGW